MRKLQFPDVDLKILPKSTRSLELCISGVTVCMFLAGLFHTHTTDDHGVDVISQIVYAFSGTTFSTAPVLFSMLHIFAIGVGQRLHYLRLVASALVLVVWMGILSATALQSTEEITPLIVMLSTIVLSLAYAFVIQLYRELR